MSKATKRKHVAKEVLDEFVLPQSHQQIVKVLSGKGNNLHEVETANGESFLVSMPTKFRKNVWIKRGDFVITEAIEEGDKVKAEIISILYKDQIKHIKQNKLWPAGFDVQNKTENNAMIPADLLPPSDDEDEDSNSDILVLNVNRPPAVYDGDSDTDSQEEDEDSDIKTAPP